MLAAWCELRQDFRHFPADRIKAARFVDELYVSRPGTLRQRWKRDMEMKRNLKGKS
ncbi:WYL domain-containing protein [Novosphingobium resinovorum]|uniref:WYL domain-containing protein n=1 Tax=Novosphingobium resinovorum TaxID=158500 RepID=UPI002ED41F75|nr:WYL domain-containing protein [Novosphingobium resinovorum]